MNYVVEIFRNISKLRDILLTYAFFLPSLSIVLIFVIWHDIEDTYEFHFFPFFFCY